MPSLPARSHRHAGFARLDQEGGQPSAVREPGEDQEQPGLGRVGDPGLGAVEPVPGSVPGGLGPQRQRVAARFGFGQGVGADGAGGQPGQVAPLLVPAAVPQQGAGHQRVLHVDDHRHGRVRPGQFLDGQHELEQAAARAAVGRGDLDAHQARAEQLLEQVIAQAGAVVHLPGQRPHGFLGKGPHGVTPLFVLRGQAGERPGAGHSSSSPPRAPSNLDSSPSASPASGKSLAWGRAGLPAVVRESPQRAGEGTGQLAGAGRGRAGPGPFGVQPAPVDQHGEHGRGGAALGLRPGPRVRAEQPVQAAPAPEVTLAAQDHQRLAGLREPGPAAGLGPLARREGAA